MKTARHSHGFTLVELLLYMGLLITILSVLYQLFSVGGTSKLREVVSDELYVASERITSDLENTIKGATSVDQPALGASSSTLSLNGGTIVYSVDGNGYLLRTDGTDTARLTADSVIVSSITFSRYGPSVDSPTIIVEYTLAGQRLVQGATRTETFRTAVTVR